MAGITALDKVGFDLYGKGHYARAAEKRSEAAASAQALGHADCLITARLQVDEAVAWIGHAHAPGVTKADAKTAVVCAWRLLRDAAIPTLERRRAGGTLLAGVCRPLEEAWYAARWDLPEFNQEDWHWQAQFVGYEAYLIAGQTAISVASWTADPGASKQVQKLVAFAVSAMDLMAQPRGHGDLALHSETILFRNLRVFHNADVFKSSPMLHQLLEDAWTRLQRSGVLRKRRIELIDDALAVRTDAHVAANRARIASAVMRGCALEACGAREVHPAQFKKCAACQGAVYCCKAHQEAHWPAHKAACKAARKAAEQGGAGPSSGGV